MSRTSARRTVLYNLRLGGATLHPVRWVIIAALGIPCGLAIALLLAKLSGHAGAGRVFLRFLRFVVGFEVLLLAVLALTGFLYERRARNHDLQLYRPPGKLVDIGGYRLHISCLGSSSGSGPTVVLEYGLEASDFDWRLVQPQIASFARACFYDRGGYGWRDPSPRPRVPSLMAEELHTLLHAAGEKPPYILVAHSFGSFNAIMFAHKFPEEVSSLVLVDGSNTLSLRPFPLRQRISLRAMQLMIPFGLPRWRGWCGGNAPNELRGEKQAISCRSSLYETFYREREAFSASVLEIRGIPSLGTLPLIVIARDPGLPGAPHEQAAGWQDIQAEKMRISSHAELVIATGSGHDIPLARPDVIVAAVKKLTLRLPAPADSRGTP